jgi:hypothetical protein
MTTLADLIRHARPHSSELAAERLKSMLDLTMPTVPGSGIADRVYTEDNAESDAITGYPAVTPGKRSLSIRAELGTLYAGRGIRAFREPVRFWARPEAVGKAVPLDYELVAREFDAPIKGSLIIHVEKK